MPVNFSYHHSSPCSPAPLFSSGLGLVVVGQWAGRARPSEGLAELGCGRSG